MTTKLFLSIFLTLFHTDENQFNIHYKYIDKKCIKLTITNNSDSTCFIADMSNTRVKNYIELDTLGVGNLVFYLYPSNIDSSKKDVLNIFMGYKAIKPNKKIRLKYKVKDTEKLNQISIQYSYQNPKDNRDNLKLKTINVR